MPRAQKDVYDLSFGVTEGMNLRIGTSTACSNVLGRVLKPVRSMPG